MEKKRLESVTIRAFPYLNYENMREIRLEVVYNGKKYTSSKALWDDEMISLYEYMVNAARDALLKLILEEQCGSEE